MTHVVSFNHNYIIQFGTVGNQLGGFSFDAIRAGSTFTPGEVIFDLRADPGVSFTYLGTNAAMNGVFYQENFGIGNIFFATNTPLPFGTGLAIVAGNFVLEPDPDDPSSNDDVIVGDSTDNTIDGLAGNDTISGKGGKDTLFGSDGNDTLNGGKGKDVLKGGKGKDVLKGEGGGDTLRGGKGNDTLGGGKGDDTLKGEGGKDTLKGGLGKDVLNGGFGNDTMTGGAGFDTFIWSKGADRITDFNAANNKEKIDLSGVSSIKHFKDLKNNHAMQDGDDLVITAANGSTLRLEGLEIGDLDKGDFIF